MQYHLEPAGTQGQAINYLSKQLIMPNYQILLGFNAQTEEKIRNPYLKDLIPLLISSRVTRLSIKIASCREQSYHHDYESQDGSQSFGSRYPFA